MNSLQIIIKCDHESGPHRQAFLFAEHFEPPMANLTAVIARQGKALVPGALKLRITEGHRLPRVPGKRDLHSELKAVDYTIVKADGSRATEDQYKLVAEATRKIVGDADYDFAVHGEGPSMHIHAEFDPHYTRT